MPEIVESKQYELFCNEQMIKSEFRQMWANFFECVPNLFRISQYFEKSEFEFLRFYCTQNLYVQQTPDILEKLAESLLYSFIVNTFC